MYAIREEVLEKEKAEVEKNKEELVKLQEKWDRTEAMMAANSAAVAENVIFIVGIYRSPSSSYPPNSSSFPFSFLTPFPFFSSNPSSSIPYPFSPTSPLSPFPFSLFPHLSSSITHPLLHPIFLRYSPLYPFLLSLICLLPCLLCLKLSLGGKKFTASKTMLAQYKDSLFTDLFNSAMPPKRNGK